MFSLKLMLELLAQYYLYVSIILFRYKPFIINRDDTPVDRTSSYIIEYIKTNW